MATYRGSDGVLTLGGSPVGELQSWEINPTRPFIDDTAMGDTAESGSLDIPNATGRMSVNFDYDDAQQASIVDMLLAGTVPTPIAAVFRMATGKELDGDILPTNATIRGQRTSGNFTMDVDFRVTGGLSVSWA